MKRFTAAFLALPALALLCAWAANRVASPRRRLAWTFAVETPTVPLLATPEIQVPVKEIHPEPSAPTAPTLALAHSPGVKVPARAPMDQPHPNPQPPSETAMAQFPWDPGRLNREITSEEALAAFRLGVPFIDARRGDEFEAGHVRGAFSAPVWEDGLSERLERFAARPAFQPRSNRLKAPVVIYCSGGSCEDSRVLAERMLSLGFGNLLIYQGGFPDWQDLGRPVVKGPAE